MCEVGLSDDVWAHIERHFHVYRAEKSGMVRGWGLWSKFSRKHRNCCETLCFPRIIVHIPSQAFMSAPCSIWSWTSTWRTLVVGEPFNWVGWVLGRNHSHWQGKSKLFLERVLFLHSLATSRATSAAQQVRLPIAQWEKEIEIACVASYVLKAMKDSIDSENCNARVFSDTVIQQCRARVIEGRPVYK